MDLGLLIGERDKGDVKVTIVDAIPLFSGFLDLTPMMEVAMEQVQAWASKNDRYIAGYYESRHGSTATVSRIEEPLVQAVGTWVGETNEPNGGPVVIALVDPSKLQASDEELFNAFTMSKGVKPVGTRTRKKIKRCATGIETQNGSCSHKRVGVWYW